MGLKYAWFGSELIRATQQLHALRIYEKYDDRYCFWLDIPGQDHPVLGVILGNGGEVYGLNLFFGPAAMRNYQRVVMSAGNRFAQNIMLKAHLWGYQMESAMGLSIEARKWIKQTKFRITRDGLYPDFLILEPGKRPKIPNDRETRTLLYAVRGIVKSCQAGTFAPRDGEPEDGIFTLVISGDADAPVVSTEIRYPEEQGDSRPAKPAETISPCFELSGLQQTDATWFVGTTIMPAYIQGDDRQPSLLMVVDPENGPVWFGLMMEAAPVSVWKELVAVFTGKAKVPEQLGIKSPQPGLPKTILFMDEDLFGTIGPQLEPLDVSCRLEPDNPKLQAILEMLSRQFDAISNPNPEMIAEQWMDSEPDADMLDAWKDVDGLLKDMMHEGFDHDRKYHGKRALKRYFGVDVDAEYFFEEYERMMIVDAYSDWFTLCYRSTGRSKTIVEKWLKDKRLPKPVRTLLQAKMQAKPSFFKFRSVDQDTGEIEFEDMLTGQSTTVTDFALSTCIEPGWILPARVFPAGDFHFFMPAGPILSSVQFSWVMEFLSDCDVRLHPDELHRHPYVLGWLWEVYDRNVTRKAKTKPILCNTDRDLLVFHTASFKVADEHKARDVLEKRDWVDWDEQDECYAWFREGTNGIPGDMTLLGRIRFIDDELILDVNSEQRFQAARKWLVKIPGVTFQAVTTRQPDKKDIPLDDRLPSSESIADNKPPAEIIQATEDYFANYYREWLDKPVPMLNGKTPRQAAKNSKLRDKVAALIRSIPDPMGNTKAPISVPRAEMLRELGLK